MVYSISQEPTYTREVAGLFNYVRPDIITYLYRQIEKWIEIKIFDDYIGNV